MGADLDRTSACARTMLGIFEPECRVPGLRQSAAALLRQIAWAGLSGRVTAEALPRCFGGVRRLRSEVFVLEAYEIARLGTLASGGYNFRPGAEGCTVDQVRAWLHHPDFPRLSPEARKAWDWFTGAGTPAPGGSKMSGIGAGGHSFHE